MFTVGQTVCVLLSKCNRHTEEVIEGFKIKAIGRKWVTIVSGWEEFKFSPVNKKFGGYELDGGKYSSPGFVYLSREEIELKNEKEELLSQLRAMCNSYSSKFENTSNENIKKALVLLRGEEVVDSTQLA